MEHKNTRTMNWVQRGPWLCLKVDGKFTGADCALEDMVADGGCAVYWRDQLKNQADVLHVDSAAVFASLDGALRAYGIKKKAIAVVST